MGEIVEVAQLPECDLCSADGRQGVPAKYDAKTKMGPWANMCGPHFQEWGIGLGTGFGQQLVLRKGAKDFRADTSGGQGRVSVVLCPDHEQDGILVQTHGEGDPATAPMVELEDVEDEWRGSPEHVAELASHTEEHPGEPCTAERCGPCAVCPEDCDQPCLEDFGCHIPEGVRR